MRDIDLVWMLLCTALVLFMQAGFLMVETGMVRARHSIHVAIKNLLDLAMTGLLFGLVGYAVMFQLDFGWWMDPRETLPDDWITFAYQLAFCGTAATIISGAVAERMRLEGYLIITAFTAILIYPVAGSWIWGSGEVAWLKNMGFVDFAGSTVVHATGGWIALAGVLVIGPRHGRFGAGATRLNGHNPGMMLLGGLFLWIGWLGFNGGSYGHFSGAVGLVIVNTMMAAIGGSLTGSLSSYAREGIVRAESAVHGLLSGLVSVTAACHVVTPDVAFVIGISGSIIAMLGIEMLERANIDDVVGAIPVHAFAGVWGTVAVALFASPEALGTGLSRWEQLQVQVLGAVAVAAWASGAGYALLKIANAVVRLRTQPEAEAVGLNVSEHGATTDLQDLIDEMARQSRAGDFSSPVQVDPHSEVGQIAYQYNQVLARVSDEAVKASDMALSANAAREEAENAQRSLQDRLLELREFNRVTVGREQRMIALKAEINALLEAQGKAPRYDLEWDDADPSR